MVFNVLCMAHHIRHINKSNQSPATAPDPLYDAADFVKHIAEATPDIIFIMNIDTKELIYANRQFTEILNFSPEQSATMRSTIFDMMYPGDIPMKLEQKEHMRTASDGELRTIEYRLVDAAGKIRWFIDR